MKFSERIIIHSKPEELFNYTKDYDNRLQWDTFLKRAELMEGAAQAAKGSKAYCVAKNGLGMETKYVSFNRPKATAIKMTKGPYLFKQFLGSWTFKDLGRGKTEVIFLYSFQLRFPFNVVSPIIQRNLRVNVRKRLRDLKRNMESTATTLII